MFAYGLCHHVISGYMVLANLGSCLVLPGCELHRFQTRQVPDFEPYTLHRAGCLPIAFEIVQEKTDILQIRIGRFTKPHYLAQEEGDIYSTTENNQYSQYKLTSELFSSSTERSFVSLAEDGFKTTLNDTRQPLIVTNYAGSGCLAQISETNNAITFSLDNDYCNNNANLSRWSFVWLTKHYDIQTCEPDQLAASIYNGFTMIDVNDRSANLSKSRILTQPLSSFFRMPARWSTRRTLRPQIAIQANVNTYQCTIQLKKFCFQVRKIGAIKLSFHSTDSQEPTIQMIHLSWRETLRYSNHCARLPSAQIYKINMEFQSIHTVSIFLRRLDLRGCFDIQV